MIFLGKYRFDFTPLVRQLFRFRLKLLPTERTGIQVRVRYPHLMLGLLFLILLLVILLALPASANPSTPYLSVNDIPNWATTSLASEAADLSAGVDTLISMPVTGQ